MSNNNVTPDSFRFLLRSSDVVDKVPANTGLLREDSEMAAGRPGTELAVVHLVNAKLDGQPELRDSSAGLYFKVGTSLELGSNNRVVRVGPVYVTTNDVRPDQRELNNDDVDYTGALWYRGDSKDFYINTTGQHNAQAWELLTPHYSNDTPTPFELGGIPAGTTFDQTRFEELVTQLLYPDAAVNLARLRIDPDPIGADNQHLTVEVGTQIPTPGGANLRTLSVLPGPYHRITHVSFVGGTNPSELLVAENAFPGGTYQGVGVNRTYTYAQADPLAYNVPTTYHWGSRLTVQGGRIIDGLQRTIRWRYRSFVEYSTSPDLMEPTNPSNLALSRLERIESWHKPAEAEDPTYLYLFLPVGRMVDNNLVADGYDTYEAVNLKNSYGVAMTTLPAVTLERNGISVRYVRYRTTYRTAYSVELELK